ncbi:MAG: glycosyltransferase family 1 protein [bacterium]|nr:glycosyltransferase family 1 protein [bacterium]
MTSHSVAIDGNEANVPNRVGSNIYAFELLTELEKQLAEKKEWDVTILLTSHPVADMPPVRKGWRYVILRPKKFWTQWALPRYLAQNKKSVDLFFTPGHYAPRYSPVPYICAVLDLAFLSHPASFTLRDRLQLTHWTKYSVQHAKKIITISQASKREVVDDYHVPANNVIVAYPAIGKIERVSAQEVLQSIKKFSLPKSFFISLGTIQPRKNLIRLIEAFESFSRKQQGLGKTTDLYHLVFAGKQGWLAKPILDRIEQSPFRELIHLTGFITETEKWALLRNAAASVTVGLKEGFGIPALEALEVGTIPIVSNTSSLPEVVGEGAILVNPTNSLEIADGLWKVATLKAREKAILRKKGREQRAKFSWKNTAATVLDLWQDVVNTS